MTGVISVRPSAAPPSDPTASGRFAAWHDDLAAMIAHDLKTPIAAVVMNLDYVLSELPADTPESVRAALEDCRAANQASSRIVADMTDVARVDAGKLRPAFAEIDVGSLLTTVAASIADEAEDKGVSVEVDADAAIVWGDAELVRRSLERLVERAIRFASNGERGRVSVTLARGVFTVRLESGASRRSVEAAPTPAVAGRSLGVHFAECVMRAQGGAVWVETDADGALAFRLAMPRRRR